MMDFSGYRGQDFLAGDATLRRTFMKRSRPLHLKKGASLFFEGDEGTNCFYVESGVVRVFRTVSSGRECLLRLHTAGALFGVAGLSDGLPRDADAQALTPVDLRVMEREDFIELRETDTAFRGRTFRLLGGAVRDLKAQVASLLLRPVGGKLIHMLLYLYGEALPAATLPGELPPLPLRVTQEQLASMIGSTQATVSRLLRELRRAGLVVPGRGRLEIVDPTALSDALSHPPLVP